MVYVKAQSENVNYIVLSTMVTGFVGRHRGLHRVTNPWLCFSNSDSKAPVSFILNAGYIRFDVLWTKLWNHLENNSVSSVAIKPFSLDLWGGSDSNVTPGRQRTWSIDTSRSRFGCRHDRYCNIQLQFLRKIRRNEVIRYTNESRFLNRIDPDEKDSTD